MVNKIGEWFLIGVIVVIIVTAVIALSAFLTMWAWNIFIVYVFGLKTIGFLQALALNMLIGVVRVSYNAGAKKKDA